MIEAHVCCGSCRRGRLLSAPDYPALDKLIAIHGFTWCAGKDWRGSAWLCRECLPHEQAARALKGFLGELRGLPALAAGLTLVGMRHGQRAGLA